MDEYQAQDIADGMDPEIVLTDEWAGTPIAKESEMTGLDAVRDKLERALSKVRHIISFAGFRAGSDLYYRIKAGEREISEALALIESEQGLPTWREACFDDACEGCCTALENRLRFVERDHEAIRETLQLAHDEMCRATFPGPVDRRGLNYAIDKVRAILGMCAHAAKGILSEMKHGK